MKFISMTLQSVIKMVTLKLEDYEFKKNVKR